jgi:4-amino-4-deoxy-L-arabinose transferase-like glycosyltransferase
MEPLERSEEVRRRTLQAVLLLIVASTAIRLVLAAAVGLGVDESYMAGFARHFSLSFYDHPPLHVWIAGFAMWITGSDAPVVLRLPFIAMFAGSTWLVFAITRELFSDRAGLWAALCLNVAPVFGVAAGGWVLPDGPLVFFSLAAFTALLPLLLSNGRVMEPGARSRDGAVLIRWIVAGALGGLALLSKYHAVFLFAGIGVFLLTTSHGRAWLRTPGPWLGLLTVAAMALPIVYWNIENGWKSVAFQAERALPESFGFLGVLRNIGGQVGYLLPWIYGALVVALVAALKRGPRQPETWLLAILSIVPVGFFAIVSVWAPVLPHWSNIGWLFAFPLLGARLAGLEGSYRGALKWTAGLTVALLFAVLSVAATQATTGWLQKLVPELRERADLTTDLIDWTPLRRVLAERGLMTPDTVIAGITWIEAGKLNYALGNEATVICVCLDPHQFMFGPGLDAHAGHDVLIVGTPLSFAELGWFLQGQFAKLEPLEAVQLMRGGRVGLKLEIFAGRGRKLPN